MLEDIIRIVHECGEILTEAADIGRKTMQKEGRGNFVTEYDSRVQAVLQKRLLGLIPEAVFFGEEDEADRADIRKGYAFIVDPIDGTANFIRDYKASCISVALAQDGMPVLGVVYNPYLKETFWAEKDRGAFLNGEPIHASDRTLSESVILFGTAPYSQELSAKSFEIAYRYFSKAQDLRRSGSAAIDLCCLACGRADFYFELRLSPWDYAAAALIVEEAGGIISDLTGGPVTYDHAQTVAARAPGVELLKL